MEVIFKAVNAGKTTEAINFAIDSTEFGNVLLVSNEQDLGDVIKGVRHKNILGTLMTNEPEEVVKAVAQMENAFTLGVDTVVLDVNFLVTHSKWFKLAMQLEEAGYTVAGTQTLLKGSHTSQTVPVVKVQ